jgi:hypothetical protein
VNTMMDGESDQDERDPWDPDVWDDRIVTEFLSELNIMINSNPYTLKRDRGRYDYGRKPSALLKYRDWKLLEYRPGGNRIIKTSDNHERARLSADLIQRYNDAVEAYGNPVKDAQLFLSLLGEMVNELEERRQRQ